MAKAKKGTAIHWNSQCAAAFQHLKDHFTSTGVLAHFDPDKPCIVETDVSNRDTAAVLSQWHGGVLRPIAYCFKKLPRRM